MQKLKIIFSELTPKFYPILLSGSALWGDQAKRIAIAPRMIYYCGRQ